MKKALKYNSIKTPEKNKKEKKIKRKIEKNKKKK